MIIGEAEIQDRDSTNAVVTLSFKLADHELCIILAGPSKFIQTILTPVEKEKTTTFSKKNGEWFEGVKISHAQQIETHPQGLRVFYPNADKFEGVDIILSDKNKVRLKEWFKGTYVLFEDSELSEKTALLPFEVLEIISLVDPSLSS